MMQKISFFTQSKLERTLNYKQTKGNIKIHIPPGNSSKTSVKNFSRKRTHHTHIIESKKRNRNH